MKIIVGLGNPGKDYVQTRHNAGFLVIDALIREWHQSAGYEQMAETHDARYERYDFVGSGQNGREKIVLIKPLSFMNRSGEVVVQLLKFTPQDFDLARDLIVVHDELDLPLGRIKVDLGASAAGHNGVKNIIDLVGTKEFIRVRIGIGTQNGLGDTRIEDFVLERWSTDEEDGIQEVIPQAIAAVKDLIVSDLETVRSRYNKKTAE